MSGELAQQCLEKADECASLAAGHLAQAGDWDHDGKARELFAASRKFAMWETFDDAWATLGPAELRQYQVRAREALTTELIVAAQNEEAYTWAKNH